MPERLPISRPCHCAASAGAANCHQPASLARRALLKGALAAGIALPFTEAALPDDLKAARPQQGDLFVFVRGDKAGTVIALADVPAGGAPLFAWPMEPSSKTVRDGSRLNQVLLVRLDADAFDDKTRARSADGVVAYSAARTPSVRSPDGKPSGNCFGVRATTRSSIRATALTSCSGQRRGRCRRCRSRLPAMPSLPPAPSSGGSGIPPEAKKTRTEGERSIHNRRRVPWKKYDWDGAFWHCPCCCCPARL
jgi:hypothetical protein